MLTAKEARAQIRNPDTDSVRQEKILAETAVNKAVEAGQYLAYVHQYFSKETIKWLKSHGYKAYNIPGSEMSVINWA